MKGAATTRVRTLEEFQSFLVEDWLHNTLLSENPGVREWHSVEDIRKDRSKLEALRSGLREFAALFPQRDGVLEGATLAQINSWGTSLFREVLGTKGGNRSYMFAIFLGRACAHYFDEKR